MAALGTIGAVEASAQTPGNAPVASQSRRDQQQPYPGDDNAVVEEPTTQRRWYGWQTLTTDASAIAVAALAATLDGNATAQPPAIGIALGTYLLGGPLVHAFHGQGGKAGGSFAVRLLAPVTLGGLAWAASQCNPIADGDMCSLGTVVATIGGAALGAVVASVVDAAAIAHEDVPKRTSLVPVVQMSKDGGSVGLAGTF